MTDVVADLVADLGIRFVGLDALIVNPQRVVAGILDLAIYMASQEARFPLLLPSLPVAEVLLRRFAD